MIPQTQAAGEKSLVKRGGKLKLPVMKSNRTCALIFSLPFLLNVAQAQFFQVRLDAAVDKSFYQRDAFLLEIDEGSFQVTLSDGGVIFSPCAGVPSLNLIPPNITCPLGSNGFVAFGDVDADGFRDAQLYYSFVDVLPAVLIEPLRPDLVSLFSAPPSKLPRPLPAFVDDSRIIFFNVFQTDLEQLFNTEYLLTLRYGAVPQIEATNTLGGILVGGNLSVVVTGRDIAGSPLTIPVAVAAGDDGPTVAEQIRLALDATPAVTDFYAVGGTGSNILLTELVANGNDPTLNIGVFPGTATAFGLPIEISQDRQQGAFKIPAATAAQMREELVPGTYTFQFPRLNNPGGTPVNIPATITSMIEAVDRNSRSKVGFRFTSGKWDDDFYQIDPRLIHVIEWTGNDRSNILPGDEIYFSVLNADEDTIDFPFLETQLPVQLQAPTVQEYTLPPFFFPVGYEGVINVDFRRNLRTTGVSFDVSERDFRAKVRMVDSYPGFTQRYFELGTLQALYPPAADKDRDGMSNIDEFALEFPTIELLETQGLDPDDIGFGSPAANDASKQPVAPVVALDADNHIEVRASVRPLSGTSLKYQFLLETTKGKKTQSKAIKTGGRRSEWTITRVTETEQLVVRGVPIDGVFVDHEYVVLRSVRPVADPTAPLPNIKVAVTPLSLQP